VNIVPIASLIGIRRKRFTDGQASRDHSRAQLVLCCGKRCLFGEWRLWPAYRRQSDRAGGRCDPERVASASRQRRRGRKHRDDQSRGARAPNGPSVVSPGAATSLATLADWCKHYSAAPDRKPCPVELAPRVDLGGQKPPMAAPLDGAPKFLKRPSGPITSFVRGRADSHFEVVGQLLAAKRTLNIGSPRLFPCDLHKD
jgi:hypothetical protein